MDQSHRYKNPPIEEALCEFRFQPSQDWDFTIPGKLHAEIGNEYRGKPQQQIAVQVGLEAQEGEPSNLRYDAGVGKILLITEDGKRMVGVGPDVLSVHMLRPYHDPLHPDHSGWDEFQPRISAALDAYWEVAEPIGVSRIGIRYINKIVIPHNTARMEDYLRCSMPVVSGLPDHLNNFMSRVEYVYEDSVRLVLSQGLVNAPADHLGFLLDLDVVWESTEPVTWDEALDKSGDLHERERDAFEAVITDKSREIFDAG